MWSGRALRFSCIVVFKGIHIHQYFTRLEGRVKIKTFKIIFSNMETICTVQIFTRTILKIRIQLPLVVYFNS